MVDVAAIAGLLRGVCKDSLAGLAPETRLDELPNMDSLKLLHVVALAEDAYGVEIDLADLEGLSTVQDLVAGVRAAVARKTA